MHRATPVEFHIVFTPGTIDLLFGFLETILRWSDCRVCVVANGCSVREQNLLRKLCHERQRLRTVVIDEPALSHGDVLNRLQNACRDPYFCFMDSDIFASAPFLPPLQAALHEHAAVFSCPPACCTANDQLLHPDDAMLYGVSRQTADGACMGVTFLAMYDNRKLAQCRQRYGIGFEQRRWSELAADQQVHLEQVGLRKHLYDTGKLLNLMLLRDGESLAWVDSPNLYHLGGVSLEAANRGLKARRILDLARGVMGPHSPEARVIRDVWRGRGASRLAALRRRELACRKYFFALLDARWRRRHPPPLPALDDPVASEQVARLTRQLLQEK